MTIPIFWSAQSYVSSLTANDVFTPYPFDVESVLIGINVLKEYFCLSVVNGFVLAVKNKINYTIFPCAR